MIIFLVPSEALPLERRTITVSKVTVFCAVPKLHI